MFAIIVFKKIRNSNRAVLLTLQLTKFLCEAALDKYTQCFYLWNICTFLILQINSNTPKSTSKDVQSTPFPTWTFGIHNYCRDLATTMRILKTFRENLKMTSVNHITHYYIKRGLIFTISVYNIAQKRYFNFILAFIYDYLFTLNQWATQVSSKE